MAKMTQCGINLIWTEQAHIMPKRCQPTVTGATQLFWGLRRAASLTLKPRAIPGSRGRNMGGPNHRFRYAITDQCEKLLPCCHNIIQRNTAGYGLHQTSVMRVPLRINQRRVRRPIKTYGQAMAPTKKALGNA